MNDQPASAYRVLARKYRPARFADLIGQEGMVRTLKSAIERGRLAHAFILTGVRGVGKTTTARILARGFNCIGPDGKSGPTAEPCGECENCRAIAEDRHVDVIEMDAASRTGVADIRELIEGVRYRPVQARYKIYIIDEVHMLSTSAFNALLKTLEEPPEHVKFIFATTEIRKVPVTVLSRCQRFDLRRIDADTLVRHFAQIAASEGVEVTPEALAMIARAADGSARDGLSLLDQAISRAEGPVDEAQVREMLGLADRTRLFDLYEALMRGDAGGTLDLFADMYEAGADPIVVLQDLLDLTHWLVRLKLMPRLAEAPGVPEVERTRGAALAQGLAMPVLTRNWQMLLKGLGEAQFAPAPKQAVEMVLIRLMHAADLPPPGDLVRQLGGAAAMTATASASGASSGAASGGSGGGARAVAGDRSGRSISAAEPRGEPHNEPVAAIVPETTAPTVLADPQNYEEIVALVAERREAILHAHLMRNVRPVRFETGRLEINPNEHAPRNLSGRLAGLLGEWTGRRWIVAISSDAGEPSIAERNAAEKQRQLSAAESHPLVRAVRERFPGAEIAAVRERAGPAVPSDPATQGDDDA
ncbi:MAG: DNA polymerase III subunit gamma/tau [Rhodospirillaceae bacterium]|nr:DNA polymerase III subunit gamma/tau [Rhodospirillaceae bacterium]